MAGRIVSGGRDAVAPSLSRPDRFDAVVVGSGPNGLVAALRLAEAGRSVLVLEAADRPGGGLRTLELTEPGFRHDACATILAMTGLSPALRGIEVETVVPPAAVAHPLDAGAAVLLRRSVAETALGLGADGAAYRRLLEPLVGRAGELFTDALGPARPPAAPLLLARFGLAGLLPASVLARSAFRGVRARALFAGLAAHSTLPLGEPGSAAYGLALQVSAHAGGWPLARGGMGSLAAALVARARRLGVEIRCGCRVDSLSSLPPHRAALLDLSPRDVLALAGDRLGGRYRRALARYRHGPGVFKVDWALDAPIPWAAPECRLAATVHVGGTLEEIAAAEREVARGGHPARPFVLLAQPTLFDATRAPAGRHTAWAYCHVPNGSDADMLGAIEGQIERFAPGFRDVVRTRSVRRPADVERHDANFVGGDISGGRPDLAQLFTRPAARLDPYSTPDPTLFVCSASTPPGAGVHGMCGWWAARSALRGALR
jgi:phytoene dehydrogenase-like protein